jgi:hypothetical protein
VGAQLRALVHDVRALVAYDADGDGVCATCIGYSTHHKGHHVVLVWLDMQPNAMFGEDDHFVTLFDALLEKQIGSANIYTPDQIRKLPEVYLSLSLQLSLVSELALTRAVLCLRVCVCVCVCCDCAVKNDWPTLGELREKFIFVLSGRGFEESTKARQSVYEATGKYAFVDIDQRYAAHQLCPLLTYVRTQRD